MWVKGVLEVYVRYTDGVSDLLTIMQISTAVHLKIQIGCAPYLYLTQRYTWGLHPKYISSKILWHWGISLMYTWEDMLQSVKRTTTFQSSPDLSTVMVQGGIHVTVLCKYIKTKCQKEVNISQGWEFVISIVYFSLLHKHTNNYFRKVWKEMALTSHCSCKIHSYISFCFVVCFYPRDMFVSDDMKPHPKVISQSSLDYVFYSDDKHMVRPLIICL